MDVDYGKIKIYPGNYDFWYQSNQLIQKQMKESNKKKEEKIKELKDFIARFGASQRSKQATSRKKTLEKIQLDEIVASNRRYPYIDFSKERQVGKEVIKVSHIWKENGEASIRDLTFDIKVGDKVLVLAENENKITTLFDILAKEVEPDKGYIEYGQTITTSYLPKDNNEYFKDKDENLVDWLRKYSKDPDETYLRGFLGRMLFSGEEALKKAKLNVQDLSMIFPHQANLRIIESAAKRMKFPLEKFYMNLSRYGNTSSASVGIALGEAIEKGLIKKGDNIALTGFGGGLTYGSVIIKWAY